MRAAKQAITPIPPQPSETLTKPSTSAASPLPNRAKQSIDAATNTIPRLLTLTFLTSPFLPKDITRNTRLRIIHKSANTRKSIDRKYNKKSLPKMFEPISLNKRPKSRSLTVLITETRLTVVTLELNGRLRLTFPSGRSRAKIGKIKNGSLSLARLEPKTEALRRSILGLFLAYSCSALSAS